MFKVLCFAIVGYKALKFFFFHCAIENIRAKAFESKVMLLHGDVLLNEDTELRVGIGYRYCGVIIHKFDLFLLFGGSGCAILMVQGS